MKLYDGVIFVLVAILVLALMFVVATEREADQMIARIHAGAVIGAAVVLAVWGLTRLSRR